jgi:sugar phosphate isomerase/epimerase
MILRNSRRSFFAQTSLGLAALAVPARGWSAAAAALDREGQPRLRLGLAAYSFREYMKDSNHERKLKVDPAKLIDLPAFIDFAAEQGCDGVELTAYYFPKMVTPEFLLRLKRQAFLRGVAISGSAVGNTFALPDGASLDAEIASVKTWIDHCAVMGAPHLRVFAGDPKGLTKDEAVKQCVRALKECGDYAAGRGVMLGVENHGGIVAQAPVLEEIINKTNHDWVRVNLDTGNFYSDAPYDDLARLAPYAVNVQFKVEINQVPGGKQPTDFARVVGILKKANYQGFVALEYEAEEDPWQAVPRHLNELRAVVNQR